MAESLQVAVDIGGTFTDVVTRNDSGDLKYFKIPTTRQNESIAVLNSIEHIETLWNVKSNAITSFRHGTTVATNAILERKGARLGLITTKGFKDVLAIGRQMRHDLYGAILESETPEFLVPGSRRKEVTERISSDGEILKEIDEKELLEVTKELIDDGVDAIAICFLFSFANNTHEKAAKELIQKHYPGIALAVSHEVDPAFREYERTVVTSFDGYVKPIIDSYLSRLEEGLKSKNVPAGLQIMQSRGGLIASELARNKPVKLFLSGPAGGVIGARITAAEAGINDLITLDIGGTSCDIALISKGKTIIRSEGIIDGYPLRVPMVDVNSIGSGGGSIAWVDAAGGLRVGPESAGSEPGPACYNKGGERPTVTDASIVLGYIDPDNFSGGAFKLDPTKAEKAIKTLADKLGLSVYETALGIHRIINAQMAEGIRLVSIQQGLDPRKFSLMSLGGGGALHATALANELGIKRVIVPPYPGVLAAAGLLAAPIEHEVAIAYSKDLNTIDFKSFNSDWEKLDSQCIKLMREEGVEDKDVKVFHFADVCYVGQGYTLPILLGEGDQIIEKLYDDFIDTHKRIYGYATRSPARIVNLRTVHQAGHGDTIGHVHIKAKPGDTGQTGTRNIKIPGSQTDVHATIHQRELMGVGAKVNGPAIIEQADTTTLIGLGWKATTDSKSNLIIDRNE